MKKILVTLALVLFFIGIGTAYSADTRGSFTFNAGTGDAKFDLNLSQLNVEAQGNLSGFISNLSLSYGISEAKVEDLIYKVEMTPADAYLAVGIAKIINEPLEVVVEKYKANRGKGWGLIAKQLGIKPGSKKFHVLKNYGGVGSEKMKGKSKGRGKKGPKRGKKK